MTLQSVRLQSFRCFDIADLEFDPHLTLIQGANGSGKTSLLEAVFLLGRGRSFRSPRLDAVVRSGQTHFGVAADLQNDTLPFSIRIEFSDGHTVGWLRGERIGALSELTMAFPVQVIDPGVHKLIEEGPVRRRRFLDWGVFHVEPNYIEVWQRFHRTLRQRNAALRQHASPTDLEPWDEALASTAKSIDDARRRYVDQARPQLVAASQDLVGLEMSIRYARGWASGQSMQEALERHRVIDSQRRTTSVGPQRADLEILIAGSEAKSVVSRGQQKLLAAGLILGQLESLARTRSLRPTLLLDDPAAELDAGAIGRFLSRVYQLGAQLVMTSLPGQVPGLPTQARMFHVKHGRVEPVL